MLSRWAVLLSARIDAPRRAVFFPKKFFPQKGYVSARKTRRPAQMLAAKHSRPANFAAQLNQSHPSLTFNSTL
jgi:hypothetical protein